MNSIVPSSITYLAPLPLGYKKPEKPNYSFASIPRLLFDGPIHNLCKKCLFSASDSPEWENKRKKLITQFQAERVRLTSPDGSVLDGMFFPSDSQNEELAEKALLFAPGANGYYEDGFSSYLVSLIKNKLGPINILIVNYPVLAGRGDVNMESMKLTVYTACCFLTEEKGILPHHMIVYGQSLGGIAATRGAKLFQDQISGSGLHLITERSFLDLPTVSKGFLGGVSGSFAKMILEYDQWKVNDVEEAFKSLKGHKLIVYSEYDGVVLSMYSMAKKLPLNSLKGSIAVLRMEGKKTQAKEHWRRFSSKEEEALIQEMGMMLNLSSKRKREHPLVRRIGSVASDVLKIDN
ncbi:hypothetical protein [Candidatus Protochlamydia phocaeensis]|uniref:hypothetical protein n=1 Tax=Candidatus Protochlamydia phocaeensis TaxID=1414722 RepID=UPI000837F5A8|nr:hypothetical protein [Candidatus Protochlamydia phocaeensis]